MMAHKVEENRRKFHEHGHESPFCDREDFTTRWWKMFGNLRDKKEEKIVRRRFKGWKY